MTTNDRFIVSCLVATSLTVTRHLESMSAMGRDREQLTVQGDNIGHYHDQMMLCCWCCWASFMDGGGAGRVLGIIDGAQIEHGHLPTFALGVTSTEHN